MALIMMEGFDHFSLDDQYPDKGWTIYKNYVSTVTGRFGIGRSMNISYYSSYAIKTLPSDYSEIHCGYALYVNSEGVPQYSSSYPFLAFSDNNATAQALFFLLDTGQIGIQDGGGTTLAISASSNLIPFKRWVYFECRIVISATVGVVEVKINGNEVINETGLDTKYGLDYIRKIRLSPINTDSTEGIYIDDLWLDDAQFHGDCIIKTFYPDADGSTTDFTPSAGNNYENVDENTPDDDTTYNQGNIVGDIDLYGITTGALGTVKGIQVNNYVRKIDAGSRTVRPIVYSNAANYDGTTQDISADFYFLTDIWEDDPDDSNPWTQTKLEASEFGLEIVA